MTEEFKSIITLVVDGFKHSAREAQQSVKDIQRQIDSTNGKRAFAEINNEMDDLKGKIETLKEAIASGKADKFEFNAQELVDDYEKQLSVLEQEAAAAKDVKEEMKEVSKISKKASQDMHSAFNFKGAGNFGSSVAGGVAQGIKSLVRYSFAIRSLYALVGKFKSFTAEGIKNLVQVSSGLNSAVSSMMSSLTQLKNSFATAFAPVIEVVAPYVTSFIQMMANAVTSVGAFFAALTGKSSFTKAVAVQQDYAASLSDAASGSKKLSDATKDAAKEQKELNRQLMGFDEINKLSDNSSKDKNSNADTNKGLTPSMMFTEESIPGMASDWVKMFKEAWETADFSEIGGIIGQKLKSTLDSIPWDTVKTQCEKVAKSVATFLNGFIEVPKLWTTIGSTIGNGFTVAFDTLNTFWETFHWDSLASGFAKGLQAAFVAFDWGEVTRGISNVVIAALDFSKGILNGINWQTLPTDLYNALVKAIKGINWKGIKQSLTDALTASLNAAIALGAGVVQLGIKLVKNGWSSLSGWVGTNKALSSAVKLAKSGWSTLTSWVGTSKALSVGIKLAKSGWKSVKDFIGDLSAKFNIKLPKVSVEWSGSPIKLPHFSIKWNAKGGILNGAQIFGMMGNTLLGGGEAGREAILPLDRNTGWMDTLAEKVGQRVGSNGSSRPIVVQVTLDGKVVGQSVVNYVNGQARATGRHPMAAYL